MKALILTDYNRFSFDDVPEPPIGSDDVLVRVKACGICGSDVHGMDGSSGRRRPPIIMGHEAAGVIEKFGANVTGWNIGDRVTFDSTVYCGTCAFCKTGRINLCNNRRVLGVSCEDYRQHGAFAEFVVVPRRILYRLPDQLPFEHAAFVEPLSIAVHAAHRANVAAHETAVVVGAGMIGLLQIQVLRAYGCSRIIAVDVAPEKLALARNLGATEAVNSASSSVVEEILQRTDGRGVDQSFECVGISATIDVAVRAVRKGGRATLIGNISPSVALPLQTVVTHELTVNGSCASCGEYPECLALMAAGTVHVDPLTSAIAPLAEGAKWFKRLYKKEAGLLKIILIP